MYIAFYRLCQVTRGDLPAEVRTEGSNTLWVCIDELGNLLLADEPGNRYWDSKVKVWRKCSPDRVMIRGGRVPTCS